LNTRAVTRSLVGRCASGRHGSIGANPGAALPAISRHRLRPDRGEYYPRAVRLEERLAQVSGTDHKKRLVAILAADAAGYSRLMAADEAATVSALDTARAVFRTQIESTQGRVIDMAGDSVLAVFELATGAVTAAQAIQHELHAASVEVPADRRMRFRIGIHLGEIIEKSDGTVYGDGVNIAARLESLAEPGGIAVSDSVHVAVRGKVDAEFQDLGEQTVKNIAHAVRAFRVKPAAIGEPTPAPAAGEIDVSLPDKPSIAVLPFDNMSGDPEQAYFADGIVEDIITELSRFQSLFVIARNTSFTYKGRSVDVKTVARELGVRFVLEGSVRRAGQRVRITAQLIDGQTGSHVWAERYEDVVSDVFELQERITHEVVASLVSEVEAEEMRQQRRGQRRFTEADDIAWRAFAAMIDGTFGGDQALTLEATRLAEAALARDQACRLAYFVLAWGHTWRVFMGWTGERAAVIDAARRAADRLIELAPNDSRAYLARGRLRAVAGDLAGGVADLRRAHELNPNDAFTLFYLSREEAAAGNCAPAKALAAQALRMSPKDRFIGVAYLAYALCAFLEQDYDALHKWAEHAIQSHGSAPIRRVMMIVYAAKTGDAALLRTHLERLNAIAPDFVPSLFRGDHWTFHQPQHMQMLLDSLRQAGLGA
jgi:adenylate cyclase